MSNKKTVKPDKTVYSQQFRFTIPKADEEVMSWIANQYNLSNSVRALIKEFVATYGCCADSTCVSRAKPLLSPEIVAQLNGKFPALPPRPVQPQAETPPQVPEIPEVSEVPEASQISQETNNNDADVAATLASMMS